MFSFLRKKKFKKANVTRFQSSLNDDKENQEKTISFVDLKPADDKNLSIDKIDLDTEESSSDKLKQVYHPSDESTTRDLCNSSPNQSCPMTHRTESILASHLASSDLNRVLTSGYLSGEKNLGYLKRAPADLVSSSTNSSQFHRPVGFSYNRPKMLSQSFQRKGMRALVTGQTKIRKVHCSPSSAIAGNDEKEAILLARYSGGFVPDPSAPKKIESLDWPAPIAIQAVPELLKGSRRRHSSISIDDKIEELSSMDDDENQRRDPQLDKEIGQMSKLKNSSGMAQAVLENLRVQEKRVARQLPLDPWKASRSASAAIEPPRRCRFDSPKFASPSRRVYTHSSSTTNPDETMAVLSTISNSSKRVSSARYSQHGDRHETERNSDLDSTINSCYSTEPEQNKSIKTVDVDGRYTMNYIDNHHHEPSTRSAPALMTNPKIYSYEQLKLMTNKRLPGDVERDHLERHLSDEEFERVFQMKRLDFYRLAEWRRIDLKKRFKLF